ncbi:MAG: TIGR00297 family protein [Methanotrichaceae archaeon]
MQRDIAARIAVGLTVLLFPYAGVCTIVPLAAIFFLDRNVRVLSASLVLLLLLNFGLGFTSLEFPLYLVAISFVAPTFAALAASRFQDLIESLVYVGTTIVLGYLAVLWTSSVYLDPERVLFLATLAGLSGSFLHTASTERDFAVPFGSCMVMWLFSFNYPLPSLEKMAIIYVFALALGLAAYWLKAADAEAVLSEVIICLLIILFGNIFWFLLLLSFYLLGSGFTRYKYSRKQELRIAQSKGGVRGYKNVYSNSLVPLAMAVCYGIYGNDIFFFAFLGAVATATGDTLASEIGETSKSKPRMITTLKVVEPGLDGGVSLLGEAASLFGAAIIGILAVSSGMIGYQGLIIAIVGGFLGTNFDSLLGATLQSRKILSNNGVNLIATLFGALIGGAIWMLLESTTLSW